MPCQIALISNGVAIRPLRAHISPSRRCRHVAQSHLGGLHLRRRDALLASSSTLLGLIPFEATGAVLVDDDEAAEVFDTAKASVVSITDFRISGGKEEFEGVGSGLVWDTRGHIATNYHCVARLAADRSGKQVTRVGVLQPGQTKLLELDATIVGTDPSRDLAVVKVDAPPGLLRPISVGTSADLRVGQTVYAIGNPSGYLHTLSAGVLSGKGRAIPSPAGTRIVGCLQTDANINAGNSGGALLDSRGRLIGMNTATFTRKGTGRGSGVNFALPVDMLVEVVPKLIVFGGPGGAREG